ncbi:hypothetical protein B0H16DRAFT_1460955 [Mycena metata]|uniref:Uncharacterized protein n=1 Tax=Mycena metata TaxID=1033252 RepID=A0AAD7IT87_9AGAR|nr:hypothetical protein B0H16DRAFT_1460955 [Mycena metata]
MVLRGIYISANIELRSGAMGSGENDARRSFIEEEKAGRNLAIRTPGVEPGIASYNNSLAGTSGREAVLHYTTSERKKKTHPTKNSGEQNSDAGNRTRAEKEAVLHYTTSEVSGWFEGSINETENDITLREEADSQKSSGECRIRTPGVEPGIASRNEARAFGRRESNPGFPRVDLGERGCVACTTSDMPAVLKVSINDMENTCAKRNTHKKAQDSRRIRKPGVEPGMASAYESAGTEKEAVLHHTTSDIPVWFEWLTNETA